MSDDSYLDFYEILQISPRANQEVVDRVFRFFAQRYHPDNHETGDADLFALVVKAHETLRNPELRQEYDRHHHQANRASGASTFVDNEDQDIELDALIQSQILKILYANRRKNVEFAGIGNFALSATLGISTESLEFHLWYLREKRWIARTETGLLAITSDGVDQLQTRAVRSNMMRKLTFNP